MSINFSHFDWDAFKQDPGRYLECWTNDNNNAREAIVEDNFINSIRVKLEHGARIEACDAERLMSIAERTPWKLKTMGQMLKVYFVRRFPEYTDAVNAFVDKYSNP